MVAPNEDFDDQEKKAINIELSEEAAEGKDSYLNRVKHSRAIWKRMKDEEGYMREFRRRRSAEAGPDQPRNP